MRFRGRGMHRRKIGIDSFMLEILTLTPEAWKPLRHIAEQQVKAKLFAE